MSDDEGRLNEDAALWHVRLRDGGDAVWEAFAEWLAEDRRHAAAYDAIEALDRDLDPIVVDLAGVVRANDDEPVTFPAAIERKPSWRWPAALGTALAAGVAGFLLYPQAGSGRLEITTAPGERRIVALGVDARVTLNGSTRLRVDQDDRRSVELVSGQAFFRVRHDPTRPFEVRVGDDVVRDIGTEFDVDRGADALRVAVAEGEVEYGSGAERLTIARGRLLVRSARDGSLRVTDVRAESVGAWRDGRLVYAGAPMSRVAEDLGRALGLDIEVAADIRDRPFSGNLALRGKGEAELRRLAAALDVAVERTARGWRIESARRATD